MMDAANNYIAAFSEDQTERLTGVTKSQLRYWDRTKFFIPYYVEENRRVSFSRVYSFRDVVSLRVLNILRNQYGVALQHLREVSEKLSHLADDKWTSARLWVLNKHVVWKDPATSNHQEVVSGQYIVPAILFDVIVSDTKNDVLGLNARDKKTQGQIARSRYINHNSFVIDGTRISVNAIKRFHEAGYSIDRIINEYPDLTVQDVKAALAFKVPEAA